MPSARVRRARSEAACVKSYIWQRRWLPWHIVCAVVAVVFLRLAWWQWEVASRPHPVGAPVQVWRNYAYAVNWVIFTGVVVWFWWRFMRDQLRVDQMREAEAVEDAAGAALASESADGSEGPKVEGETVRENATLPVNCEVQTEGQAAGPVGDER